MAAAPVLILYATGWRYNLSTNTVEKRTAIAISTVQRGAQVAINGKSVSETTPLTVNNLTSGSYTITVSDEGYFPWTKSVYAYPDKVTRISDIYLIPRLIEPATEPGQYNSLVLSPSAEYIAAISENRIDLFDSHKQKIGSWDMAGPVSELDWSMDEKYLLTKTSDDAYVIIIPSEKDKRIDLSDYTDDPITRYRWSQSEDNVLFIKTTTALLRLNLVQETKTTIGDDTGRMYLSDTLYEQRTNATLALINSLLETTTVLPIPLAHEVTYRTAGEGNIMVHDLTDNKLYLAEMSTTTVHEFPHASAWYDWDGSSRYLVYNNANEIWLYDWRTQSHNLILRTSRVIKQSLLIAYNTHIAFNTDDGVVSVVEITGPQRNSYQYQLEHINFIVSDSAHQRTIALGSAGMYFLGY